MEEEGKVRDMVTPGEVLGKASDVRPGKGTYAVPYNDLVYASLTGIHHSVPPVPDSTDQRPTVEVTDHKAHGAVPETGSVIIARSSSSRDGFGGTDLVAVEVRFTGKTVFKIRGEGARDEEWIRLGLSPSKVFSLGGSKGLFGMLERCPNCQFISKYVLSHL
ncbi:hypothetical protein CJ030_MR8G022020 [Morella rubra]|uniref:Exosome complex component N-terminal domain-containing protein n=1 Tax=Morella rubra TaxID=262757 RepID=A0A6A1UQ25_9ROSI|nr:hypothetical protein CJ030_MR8G022020 [Morella rubra]